MHGDRFVRYPAQGDGLARGDQEVTPTRSIDGALRTHLQTCLNSVELLRELELPPPAFQCVAQLERAVQRLINCFTRPKP